MVSFAPSLSYATVINTSPVNNNKVVRYNGENKKRRYINSAEERELLESYYETNVGAVGDEYVLFDASPEYVDTLPHGRRSTVTHKETEELREKQVQNKASNQWGQYFVMRKRIMAPTIKS
ncbi:MAG: hypothetical protein JJW01_03650 [Alphaproteobacteria bacterium]|nr:hypothetical protein [Rickettsiales bacterium]